MQMRRVQGAQVRWVARTRVLVEIRFGTAALAAGLLLGVAQALLSR